MKRYVMECVGTFFLAVAITLIGNPLSIGLMLMAMIYVGGHISGGHFNPAVSFACFMRNRLKMVDFVKYVLAQSIGAALALCFFMFISNNPFSLDMVPGSPMLAPMALEALLMLVLCWVYLSMNFGRYKDTAVPGMVVGLTLMAIVSAGSLFNPAIAIASMACNTFKSGAFGGMTSVIVYVVGPLLGAFGASQLFEYFRSEA